MENQIRQAASCLRSELWIYLPEKKMPQRIRKSKGMNSSARHVDEIILCLARSLCKVFFFVWAARESSSISWSLEGNGRNGSGYWRVETEAREKREKQQATHARTRLLASRVGTNSDSELTPPGRSDGRAPSKGMFRLCSLGMSPCKSKHAPPLPNLGRRCSLYIRKPP